MVDTVLVDARNFDQIAPRILSEVRGASLIGFDIETQDDDRHDGLNRFMKVDPRSGKVGNKKLVFDTRKTTVTGFSLYPDKGENSYYVNLNHHDHENRVPWDKARTLLDAKPAETCWVIHNAPFELTMMKASLGYDLDKYICTLQMAVSAYGPDEYNIARFMGAGLGGIAKLLKPIVQEFATYDPAKGRDSMTPEQAELFSSVIAKESDSDHSYNGLVKSIAYGYGLKQAVESWFGVKMKTFEQTLGGKAHMGQLTGEEVASYGGDDSFWAVQLYHRLLKYMLETNPTVVETYFNQELPMLPVYADVWRTGMKVNLKAVGDRTQTERAECAAVLRRLKAAVRSLLPFSDQINEKLAKYESWYVKNAAKYRINIVSWANSPDTDDDFKQAWQVRGPVSNAWAAEKGLKESVGPNFSHHMPVRVLLYDLIGTKPIVSKGKVQSDADSRGRVQTRFEKQLKAGEDVTAPLEVLKGLAAIAGIEQRMKLYLTPYSMLTDPETQRVYPVLSSKLATRRMATQFPNPMQLAKRGESTYIRGFYEADDDECVQVSSDWSGIELVEIGEFSGDPEFAKAFGQLPYEDLHAGAAADILAVEVEGLDEAQFKAIRLMDKAALQQLHHRLRTNLKGEPMEDGKKAYGYWRTEIGKGANFNYWYSGALSTVGERMGWSSETMWEATDRYRKRFAVAEAWRVETIEKAMRDGYIQLPDGHRRVKFEVTNHWREIMWAKFGIYENDALRKFGNEVVRAVQSRAKNQIINAYIQGTCATLAKRSIPKINERIKKAGLRAARFMLPVHDELVYNCHKSDVLGLIPIMKDVMRDHPDIIKNLKIHSTVSIGRTFEPFDGKKVLLGQIELDEAPEVSWLPKEAWAKALDDRQIQSVVDYLFDDAMRRAA